MSRQVRFRPAAVRDRKRLVAFFADAPPNVAEAMLLLLEKRTQQLIRRPFIGRPVSDEIRETIVAYGKSRYVMRYAVSDAFITIVRIWHGRENLPR